MARETNPEKYTVRSTDGTFWKILRSQVVAVADFVVTDGKPDSTQYTSAVEWARLVDGNATFAKGRNVIEKQTHNRGKRMFAGKPFMTGATSFLDVLDPAVLTWLRTVKVDTDESVRIRITDGLGVRDEDYSLVYIASQNNKELAVVFYDPEITAAGGITFDFAADGSTIASMAVTIEGLAVPDRAADDQVGFIQLK